MFQLREKGMGQKSSKDSARTTSSFRFLLHMPLFARMDKIMQKGHELTQVLMGRSQTAGFGEREAAPTRRKCEHIDV